MLDRLTTLPDLGESHPRSTLLRMTSALILQWDASWGLGRSSFKATKGIYITSRGLGSRASKVPSSPDKSILPSACATWDLGYVRGSGKQRKGRTGEITVSRQTGRELSVLEGSIWWSLPALSPAHPVFSGPRSTGRSPFSLRFPCWCDLGSQPSLVIWAVIGSKLLKMGNYLSTSLLHPQVTCPCPAGLWHWSAAPQDRGKTARMLPGSQLQKSESKGVSQPCEYSRYS